MGSYRHLKVWRSAHALACDVYKLTRTFPPTERFGLGDQLRRASISVGANIAEGCGRNGDRELARYLDIALGSANELEYLLEVSRDVEVAPSEAADSMMRKAREICRMLSALQRAARRGSAHKTPGNAARSAVSDS